jgi:hypothetical protein
MEFAHENYRGFGNIYRGSGKISKLEEKVEELVKKKLFIFQDLLSPNLVQCHSSDSTAC